MSGYSYGRAPSGIGPRDLTQFNFNGTPGDALGGSMYWGASLEFQTPLYFLPKDAGVKFAVFADAGSLWNYKGPTQFANGFQMRSYRAPRLTVSLLVACQSSWIHEATLGPLNGSLFWPTPIV